MYAQIGNAVPVKMARAIAREIKRIMENKVEDEQKRL